tara:strand:+ start:771 stop:1181 length:411 start_codon:yes stop_codon:yes gene_type:complete
MSNLRTIQELQDGLELQKPTPEIEQPRRSFPGRGQRLGSITDRMEVDMEAEEIPEMLSAPTNPQESQLELMSQPDITRSFIDSAAELMAQAAMTPMRTLTPLNHNRMPVNPMQAMAADQMINTILRNQRLLDLGCV